MNLADRCCEIDLEDVVFVENRDSFVIDLLVRTENGGVQAKRALSPFSVMPECIYLRMLRAEELFVYFRSQLLW